MPVIEPTMGLSLPTDDDTFDEQNYDNAIYTRIAVHDHSAGNGVPVKRADTLHVTNGLFVDSGDLLVLSGRFTDVASGHSLYYDTGNARWALSDQLIVAGQLSATALSVTSGPTTFFSVATDGTVSFGGVGQRIAADFSNAVVASRAIVQTNTVNGNTHVGLMANGTGTDSAIELFAGSAVANASVGQFLATATSVSLRATVTGTGAYLPLLFYTNDNERARIDTAGRLGVGTTAPSAKLDVLGTVRATSQTIPTAGSGLEMQWDGTYAYLSAYNRTSGASLPLIAQGSYVQVQANGVLQATFGTSQNSLAAYLSIPSRVGPQVVLSDNGAGTGYGLGINASELSLFSAGVVGFRANNNAGGRGVSIDPSAGSVAATGYVSAGTVVSATAGDVNANRGNNTGYYFFPGGRYLGFDGANYQLVSNWLYIQGQAAVTAGNSSTFPFTGGPYSNDWFYQNTNGRGIYNISAGLGFNMNSGTAGPQIYGGTFSGEIVQSRSRNDGNNRMATGGNTTIDFTTQDGGCFNTGSYIYLPDLNQVYNREFWVKNLTGAAFSVYVTNGSGIYATTWVNPFTLQQGDSITVKAASPYGGWMLV